MSGMLSQGLLAYPFQTKESHRQTALSVYHVLMEPTAEEIAAFYQHQTLVYTMRVYDAAMLILARVGGEEAMNKLKTIHEDGKFFIPPPFPTEE